MTSRYLLPLLALLTAPAFAQTDSLRVSYSVEPPDSSESRWREPYRYLTRANVEEKTLVKVGFWPRVGWNSWYAGGLVAELAGEVTIERKLRPNWSVVGGFNYQIGRNAVLVDDYFWLAGAWLKGGFRNYYSIRRRIRQGRSGDNFSNNYWGVEVLAPVVGRVFTSYDSHLNGLYPVGPLVPGHTWRTVPNQPVQTQVYWGIQRRVGRVGYVDFHTGLRYDPTAPGRIARRSDLHKAGSTGYFTIGNVGFHATFRIGLGW